MSSLVALLIMINAEHATGCGRYGARSPQLRQKEARRHARENYQRRKAVEIRHAHPSRKPGDLRIVPLDGECDRCGAKNAEVVCVMRVLPYVLARKYQVLSRCLLNPRMEFIAPARTQRVHSRRRAPQQWIQNRIGATGTSEHE